MCLESKVARRARADCIEAFGGKVYDLGIVRDPERCAQQRSAHCCGDRAEDPDARNSQYVLAWDAGHAIGDDSTALAVREAFLRDDRVDYVIDRGHLYHLDGTSHPADGHFDHDHITFKPSAVNDDRPFTFGDDDLTPEDRKWLTTEFANITTRTSAIVEKFTDELFTQEQKHNTAERERDKAEEKRDAESKAREQATVSALAVISRRLDAIEAKLPD